MPGRGTLNRWSTHLLIPLVRAYVRYAPFTCSKRSFWNRIVDPYFAWHSHRFLASTIFGSRIGGNTKDILQQYVYYFGVWEPHLTRWMSQRLAPGDTFVDVGANIGYFSLLASRLVGPDGRVVAIEPSPQIFDALKHNLARNGARNARAVNVAASDREGMVSLFSGPESNIGLTTIVDKQGYEFQCEVEAAPLSVVLRPEEMDNVRLIKIDVEGAEWLVVAGMRSLLERRDTQLEVAIEVSPQRLAKQGQCVEDIMKTFADAGFHRYSLANDYSASSYLPPRKDVRPVRVRAPVQSHTDLILSREDSEVL
jgi:FkbM family methyltransferase